MINSENQETPDLISGQTHARYRVLARQPLSFDVSSGVNVNDLLIQGIACRIAVRPAHDDPARQRETGGSVLAVEFEGDSDSDLIAIARQGFELLEDFLSALGIVTGFTFGPSLLVQVARLNHHKDENCEFLLFLQLPLNHWSKPLSKDTCAAAKRLLAHWDGLEKGNRLRRAARQYREAIGNLDDVIAFQEAYIGLEAMEPPLAEIAGLPAGTEEVKGNCAKCGWEFTRKKTSLVGVRAFVLGSSDVAECEKQRKSDWKLINNLRNDLMHGLADETAVSSKARDALIATMHYLHSGICACSHAPELASDNYRLARGGLRYVIHGLCSMNGWSDLTEWFELIELSSLRWVPHTKYGFVPEMGMRVSGLNGLEVAVFRLSEPLSSASMESLEVALIERS